MMESSSLARFMLSPEAVESVWFDSSSDVGALLDGPMT